MSTLLFNCTITGKGGDQDTDSAHFLQSAVLERSLPEARRLRGLYEAKRWLRWGRRDVSKENLLQSCQSGIVPLGETDFHCAEA